MGGGGDDVGERHRVRVQTGRHQTGDVRHVDKQVGTHGIGDVTEALPVDDARIGRETGDDHLRLVLARQRLNLVVVDLAGLQDDAVLHRVVDLAREVDLGAVGQVTTVSEAHAQHGVVRLEQGHVYRCVGLRAGVRLHVDVVGAEQLLGTVDGELFDHVDMLAATVVTLAGIALSVLVGQHAALRFEHTRAGVVLGCDQFDVRLLAHVLGVHGSLEFVVEASDAVGHCKHDGVSPRWY